MGDADLQSALLALDVAIQTEKDGREFYKRAAENTADPGGKVLFTSLADDELEHLDLLESQREALAKAGHWQPGSDAERRERPARVEGAPVFSRAALAENVKHTHPICPHCAWRS